MRESPLFSRWRRDGRENRKATEESRQQEARNKAAGKESE